MLEFVDVGRRSLAAYRGIAPPAILDELQLLTGDPRGLRILQLNATPYGGEVSELLRSGVPLLNDLGTVAEWRIIIGATADAVDSRGDLGKRRRRGRPEQSGADDAKRTNDERPEHAVRPHEAPETLRPAPGFLSGPGEPIRLTGHPVVSRQSRV
jgi:hypothetical protein